MQAIAVLDDRNVTLASFENLTMEIEQIVQQTIQVNDKLEVLQDLEVKIMNAYTDISENAFNLQALEELDRQIMAVFEATFDIAAIEAALNFSEGDEPSTLDRLRRLQDTVTARIKLNELVSEVSSDPTTNLNNLVSGLSFSLTGSESP